MIVFIFFKILMSVYSFEKDTVDVCSGIFAFFSCIEFFLTILAVAFNFGEIVTFIKGLVKESKGLEK